MRVALDTETRAVDFSVIPYSELACVSFATEAGSGVLERAEGLRLCEAVLSDPSCELVFYNAAFDMGIIAHEAPDIEPLIWKAYDEGRITCLEIASKLDDIARGVYEPKRPGAYTLQTKLRDYCSIEVEKEDTYRLRYGELIGTPIDQWPEEAITYARRDAEVLLPFREAIYLPEDTHRQSGYDFALNCTAKLGMRTDGPRVEKLINDTIEEASALCRKLIKKGWIEFNKDGEIKTNEKVIKAYAETLPNVIRTKPSKTYPKGQVSISADACEQSWDPDLIEYAKLSAFLDLLNKDAKYLTKEVVRTSYGLAKSGRTTSYRENLQNLKVFGGIRECFIPPAGMVYVGADYSGLELYTFAQLCLKMLGRSKLAEKLASGIDPHTELACLILGIDYQEGKRRKELGANDPEFHFARQCGKAANFGFPGGLGPKSFIEYARSNYGVKLGETYEKAFEMANKVRFFWRQANPEWFAYFDIINQMTGGHKGQIEHLFSGRLRGDCYFTEAANSLFQGLGSDAAKAALYEVTKACRLGAKGLQGCHPVVFVHDEIICQAPESRCHEAAHALADLMVTAGSVFLPDVGCKTELFASRRWSKKAKPIYVDENGNQVKEGGRLVPWDG